MNVFMDFGNGYVDRAVFIGKVEIVSVHGDKLLMRIHAPSYCIRSIPIIFVDYTIQYRVKSLRPDP